ncbi:Na+/H+ antiporter family protein [Oceanisphaera arctica]|uniref:Sodium:proton antiporter n=1 Tax=Oceanisphaera arctica TaxID=641510 RepID=A0A2P5TNT0_9GAMM|nr:Na+/H+ antiporter NhaC family protein [Oceanisphaera arctica]PPL17241.1 sodium:proton antiporter [Oceanisphaera arctica]GHA20323.1 sodium:proton antiporter [Oceanisphaera arctica]
MNTIVLAVLIMIVLSLVRVPVVIALVVSAVVGGLYAGMPIAEITAAFNGGLGSGAVVALASATLGAFAVALSRTGIADVIAGKTLRLIGASQDATRLKYVKWGIYAALVVIGFSADTIVPIHIAFIPMLIPPLLGLMNMMKLDRRIIACVLTFSIVIPYMIAPVGFGAIFLNDILTQNVNEAGASLGIAVTNDMAPKAMLIPALGMVVGLLIAVFFSYRKPRDYQHVEYHQPVAGSEPQDEEPRRLSVLQLCVLGVAVGGALLVQVWTGSMVLGGLLGFTVLSMNGLFKWKDQDDVFTQGMRLMAFIGFVMIAAAGFAGVMKATGAIPELVSGAADIIGDSPAMAALVMLLVGLFITMGIGSSFSTVPIIAAIFVPMAMHFGFSPMATIALVGTAGALGDAGSPASDSTLGPTAGLNVDGQHDHIRDSVIPTFMHYNIPLILFGWIAAQVL